MSKLAKDLVSAIDNPSLGDATPMLIGTVCSGSQVFSHALDILKAELMKKGKKWDGKLLFTCELDKKKRVFEQDTLQDRDVCVFTDIRHLCAGSCLKLFVKQNETT